MEQMKTSVFGTLTVMFKAIGRPVDKPMLEVWARLLLKESLTLEQIKELCNAAIRDRKLNSHNLTYAKLLDYGPEQVDPDKIDAVQEWDMVYYSICKFGVRVFKESWECKLIPESRAALRSIGGADRINDTHPSKLEWLKKDFISHVESRAVDPKRIPAHEFNLLGNPKMRKILESKGLVDGNKKR